MQIRSNVRPRALVGPLVIANLFLLAVSLVAGRALYANAFAYADALNMMNPYPQLDAAGGTDVVARNLAQYVRHWYFGLNGRWSQALMNGALASVTKLFGFGPESFPWWMMRSLSLFCILATPMNFLAGAGAFTTPVRRMGVWLLIMAWATSSFSQNTYAYSLWFDCLLTDRFVPMYLASLLSVSVARGWPHPRPLELIRFAALYLFVAVEQFLVTLPILLTAYAVIDRGPIFTSRAVRIFVGSIALSAVSSAIYFSSPGQQWRNGLMNVKTPDLSPIGLFTWFQHAMPLAYGVLFGQREGWIYWSLQLLLLIGGTVAVTAFVVRHTRSLNRPVPGRGSSQKTPNVGWSSPHASTLRTPPVSRHCW